MLEISHFFPATGVIKSVCQVLFFKNKHMAVEHLGDLCVETKFHAFMASEKLDGQNQVAGSSFNITSTDGRMDLPPTSLHTFL